MTKLLEVMKSLEVYYYNAWDLEEIGRDWEIVRHKLNAGITTWWTYTQVSIWRIMSSNRMDGPKPRILRGNGTVDNYVEIYYFLRSYDSCCVMATESFIEVLFQGLGTKYFPLPLSHEQFTQVWHSSSTWVSLIYVKTEHKIQQQPCAQQHQTKGSPTQVEDKPREFYIH